MRRWRNLTRSSRLIDKNTRIALCPNENEPVENSHYQQLDEWDDTIAEVEAELEKAEENEDVETIDRLSTYLSQLNENRARAATEGRWEISTEAIEAYREIGGNMAIALSSIWDNSNNESVYSQLDQYLNGTIDADQLITALARMVQMRRLEEL